MSQIINNHLIVGLGGTGGKVIRDFRRLYARESTLNSAVKYEFLYMDTNPEFMQHDDPSWKVLGKSVQLDQSQQLLVQGANLGAVIDNPAGYPQIEPWLHPIAPIKNLVNVNTVAGGQRRKFGRFLLANRAREFVGKLTDRITILKVNRSSSVVVHVIAGLAGGTGSGSVVDVVAQIRKTYPDSHAVRILVYAVLPESVPKAGWDSGNYHANGYAALVELNALAVGRYLPHDLTGQDGNRVDRSPIFFNGCYLLTNENVGGYTVDTDKELPGIIAEFIFAKTQTVGWTDLARAENSENGDQSDEASVVAESEKERSPRFLSFGIRRMVVPNEEIEEYLTYNFAQRAVHQAVFNNWVDGLGYSDEPRPADFGAEVRSPGSLDKWKMTDDHLTLSSGILPEDAANPRWKKIGQFWDTTIDAQATDIKNTKADQGVWFSELKARTEKVFDEGYRGLGGVKKFYEVKLKARMDMARCVRDAVETGLFEDWINGRRSTTEIDRLLYALIGYLEERLAGLNGKLDAVSKATTSSSQKILEIEKRIGDVGPVGRLAGKLKQYFEEGAPHLKDLMTCRTQEEGLQFANKLLQEIVQQMIDLKATVGQFQSKLLDCSESFKRQIGARLKQEQVDYRQKIFNPEDIRSLSQSLLTREDAQKEQTSAVRKKLLGQIVGQKPGFTALNQRLGIGDLIAEFETVCSTEANRFAGESANGTRNKVLDVNIVEKIRDDYGASDDRLSQFVRDSINKAQVFVKYNQSEVNLAGKGTVSDRVGKVLKTTGVLLPRCEAQPDFRNILKKRFEANKAGASSFNVLPLDPADDKPLTTDDDESKSQSERPNELTVIGVENLFTLRCVEPVALLRSRYEMRRKSSEEARALMHGEGDGNQFPPLFIPKLDDIPSAKIPYVLLAKSMGMIKERADRQTGKPTTIFSYENDGFPEEVQLGNGVFLTAIEAPDQLNGDILNRIKTDVAAQIKAAQFAQRNEWHNGVKSFVREIYEARGQDAGDPVYKKYAAMAQGDIKRLLDIQ